MKLFVDDIRTPFEDESWTVARTIDEAKRYLVTGMVNEITLGHDMGACQECVVEGKHIGDMATPETTFSNWCPHVDDGYTLLRWIIIEGYLPGIINIHSMNPIGKQRMIRLLGLIGASA